MKKVLPLTGVAVACFAAMGFGQLNPTISGEDMLCPDATTILTTQTFDSYQWYQRYFGSNDTVLIPGATSQTLLIDYNNYAASWLIVEVTGSSTTEMSPEFFVDGWAFIPPTVMTAGDFTIGQNGETIVCEGDTAYFELMQPYDTNITWYESGNPIAGQTSTIYMITEDGNFTVSGAPQVCPDWIQNLGVTLVVDVIDCSTTGIGENALSEVKLFPNPATNELTIEHDSEVIDRVTIHNTMGQVVRVLSVNKTVITFDIQGLKKGAYFVTVNYGDKTEVKPLSIQ